MDDVAVFKVTVSTRKNGSECEDEFEVPISELNGLTDDEAHDYVWGEYGRDAVWNLLDAGMQKLTTKRPLEKSCD